MFAGLLADLQPYFCAAHRSTTSKDLNLMRQPNPIIGNSPRAKVHDQEYQSDNKILLLNRMMILALGLIIL